MSRPTLAGAQVVPLAPPLSDSQLADLHKVTSWRIDYQFTKTDNSSANGTGASINGTNQISVSRWSTQITESKTYDLTFFVSGSPGCPVTGSGCGADYSLVGVASMQFSRNINVLANIDNCTLQTGPGLQITAIVNNINSGLVPLDGKAAGPGGVNSGHSFDNANFWIDYRTNPPRAELDSDLEFQGPYADAETGCLLDRTTTPLGAEGTDSSFAFRDNPNVVFDVGDTQVRYGADGFVISGSYDVVQNITNDPHLCHASFEGGFFFGVREVIAPIASCSTQFHQHASWVARPAHSALSIVGLEVTQATQKMETPLSLEADLLSSDGKPPISIVAGKPAVLRVYLAEVKQPTKATVEVTDPSGTLDAVAELMPGCTPSNRRRQETITGGVQCRSVDDYFTPPAGPWTAIVTLKDVNGNVLETHTFQFRSVSTTPLKLLPVYVCDAEVATVFQCGSVAQFSGLLSFFRSTFPGDVQLASSTKPLAKLTTTGGGDWWAAVINDILNLWTRDGEPTDTYYYGVVRQQLPGPPDKGSIGGMGYQPGHAAAGRTSWFVNDMSGTFADDAAGVVAHEVGHNLGRQHVPSPSAFGCYGDPKDLDPKWPYGNTPFVQEIGFDVALGKAVLPETNADWMSYCTPRWISPYTYSGVLAGAIPASSGSSPLAAVTAGQFWLASGTIENGIATLDPLFLFDANGSMSPGSGSNRIEIQDVGGNILFTRFFDLGHAHWTNVFEGPPRFSELVPVMPGAARIAVLGPDGSELTARTLGGTPPTVQVTFPAGGERLAGAQKLLWSVHDPNSSQHTFWVEYSADDGRTWQTLAPGIDTTELAVNFDALPGSRSARVRVLASDGVNTGRGVSGPFAVTLKPPAARISFPRDGATFQKGQLVWLQAFALDPEDGFLNADAVRWQSNRDGDLGTSSELQLTSLSVGDHRITLTVTDAAGNQATDAITISVGEANFNEGPPPVAADTTPPMTTAGVSPVANIAGWNNSDVTVMLNATDNAGGSGVKQITYTVNGANNIVNSGSASFVISSEGINTVKFSAMDNAGNMEASHVLVIKLDKTPPTISVNRTPGPNSHGWNNTDVTVSFLCSDALSGLAAGSPPSPVVLTAEGAGQSAAGACSDVAGNSASMKIDGINIDKTPPSITVTRNPDANSFGWNNTDVTVTFGCSDALSGIDTCTPAQVVTTEGAGQSRTGIATDIAGNTASTTIANINIDKTPPTLACSATPNVLWPPNNKLVPVNASIALTDSLSGSAGFQLSSVTSNELDSGGGDIVGWNIGAASTSGELRATRLGSGTGRTYTLLYSGYDKAGNTATCAPTVTVPHDQGNH